MNTFFSRLKQSKILHWFFPGAGSSRFPGSKEYWESRYKNKGNSGGGSYGASAEYKAAVLNSFVKENNISSVVEFGCGDGNQLRYLDFPNYIGLDVSETAVQNCSGLYKDDPSKKFGVIQPGFSNKGNFDLPAELALSLDVIYHLVEDEVFDAYMKMLFAASSKYVIIYAWDILGDANYHVRHRQFSKWVNEHAKDFHLQQHIPSKDGFCDFFIYKK